MIDIWKGYSCYKVFRGFNGEWLPKPKYAVFRDGYLVGMVDTETEAGQAFRLSPPLDLRLEDFEGIDRRLRS